MLTVTGIDTYYGLSHILTDVSLEVKQGEIVCLLGRNGAGKTTTMRSIMGLTPPARGKVTFKGKEIASRKPFQICRAGIGYVPDQRIVFAELTVEENLEISERAPRIKNPGTVWTQETIYSMFPHLKSIRTRKAGVLSGGEQQMLTVARALVTNPEFLLLDEPTEGLAPLIVRELAENIRSLKDHGLTILLAEQNQEVAFSLSDRAYIIDNGRIRFSGTIDELKANEEVRRKYLLI